MQAVNDCVKCPIWYIISKERSPKCTKCPMKSRTPVEGTLYALVSEEKKEKTPALNLQWFPCAQQPRGNYWQLTVSDWVECTHCLLCYGSARWFQGNSVNYGLAFIPSVMQATISMMFTASALVLYFYSEGLYNVNKMLTRTNFAKSVRLCIAKFTNPIWFLWNCATAPTSSESLENELSLSYVRNR